MTIPQAADASKIVNGNSTYRPEISLLVMPGLVHPVTSIHIERFGFETQDVFTDRRRCSVYGVLNCGPPQLILQVFDFFADGYEFLVILGLQGLISRLFQFPYFRLDIRLVDA